MRLAITALVFLGGLFFIMSGLSFLLQPQSIASSLGLAPNGSTGLATLRADFFAFFTLLGICMIWGAWKRRGDLLLLPAVALILAVIARLWSVAMDGMSPTFISSVAIEAVIAALLLFARAILPHHRVQDVGD